MTKKNHTPASPVRISAKIRRAMELIAHEGCSIVKACEEAGCSTAGYHKAMQRAGVPEYLEELKVRFVLEADHRKAFVARRALETALILLEHSKSDMVRAKMVEFFLSDGKAPAVQVNVQNSVGGAYEYAPRGSRIVEIEAQDAIEGSAVEGSPDTSPRNMPEAGE